MSIAKTISDIVRNRKTEIAPKYESCWSEAKSIVDFAAKLDSLIHSDNWKTLLDDYPNFNESWKKISQEVETFIGGVTESIGNFEGDVIKPKGYFEAISNKINKEVVEVCVTGPVSTGKSVFLRALTGAPETVIPSGKNKTTAARTIFNNTSEDNISAEITFLTREEFQDIINEYVTQLNSIRKDKSIKDFEKWNPTTETLSDFCDKIKQSPSYDPLQYPKSTIPGVDTLVTADKYFETFQMYIDHCSQYDYLLDNANKPLSKQDIDDGKLVPYVSYKNDKEDLSEDLFCQALAVREAIVNWPLRTSGEQDLGSLRLVDTMGIGEAKFCVEEDLLRIVREHADLAVALCRIKSDNDNKENLENSCFIKVLSNIKDRKMQDWVYYLCNKEDSANITDKTVNDLRGQLWKEMKNNSDSFVLNDDYWSSIEFILEGKENHKDIIYYFTNIVLGNLNKNIKNVDSYFIEELHKIFNKYVEERKNILTKLKQCLVDLPAFSNLQKTKDVENEVVHIFEELNSNLKEYRNNLFSKDRELRGKIIGKVKPILKDPEIFNVYGIRELDISYDVNVAFTKLFMSTLDAINHSILTAEDAVVKWEVIENEVISKVASISKIEKSKCSEMVKDHSEFFSKYLKNACEAISMNFNHVKSNLNIDDPSRSCNCSGRELEFFIIMREKLYKAIWEKMSIASDTIGISDNDINVVKLQLCQRVRNVLVQNHIIKDDKSNALKWINEFAASIESISLVNAFEEFSQATINLPAIVDDQTGKELRRNLLKVNLLYNDEKTAAKSIWRCLCHLDCVLRTDLLKKYEITFDNYDVYVNMLTPLFDNVFCLDQDESSKSHCDAYMELRSFVKNMVTLNYEKKDTAKCADAAQKFRLLCK